MNNDTATNLIILGNGFDMHCGLHSSFDQFFSSEFSGQKKFAQDVYNAFYKHMFQNAGKDKESKLKRSSVFGLLIKTCFPSLKGVFINDDINKDKLLFRKLSYNNFWVIYFLLLYPYYNSNKGISFAHADWSDVEAQLAQFFNIYSKPIEDYLNILEKYAHKLERSTSKYNLVDQLSSDIVNELKTPQELNINVNFNRNNYKKYHSLLNSRFLILNIIIYALIISGYHLQQGHLYGFLLNKLYNFENKLQTYLSKMPKNNMSKCLYDENIIMSLNKLDYNNENYNILTFNYTLLDSRVKHSLKHFEKIRNIHSTLQRHPIIGIGPLNNNQTKYFRFTKTYRIMKLSALNNASHILSNDIHNIIFYGHSLEFADFPYFKSIFDKYDIENNCNLVFFYSTNFDGGDKEEDKQFDRVFKLITEYDKTGNLLNKLLIEDRLHIKELPNDIFHLKRMGSETEAKYFKDNGKDKMMIIKGSKISSKGSLQSLKKNKRGDYNIYNTLKGRIIKNGIFTKNQSESPSTAANIILKGSYDGLQLWKQKKDGFTINLNQIKNDVKK